MLLNVNTDLATWLTNCLNERGWSIRELSRRAAVSHSAISRVLSGNAKPSYRFCIAVASTLNETPETVLRLAHILKPELPPVEFEQELLAEYRALDTNGQREARLLIQALREAKMSYK